MIDSVTITAHDKFNEIIAEAQRGDSIFNAEGIIYADYEQQKKIKTAEYKLFDDDEYRENVLQEVGLDYNNEEHIQIYDTVVECIVKETNNAKKANPTEKVNVDFVYQNVEKDLGERFKDNTDYTSLLRTMWNMNGKEIIEKVEQKTMYIPKIRTEELGEEKYIIQDFNLDLTDMLYVPIVNDILIKNLLDYEDDVKIIKGRVIDYNTIRPEKMLVDEIRKINEIDYEKCPTLIQKIVIQFLSYYRKKYAEEEVRNICLMNKKDIISKFKTQLLQNLAVVYDGIIDTPFGIETIVNDHIVDVSNGLTNLYVEPETGKNIKQYTYTGAKKSILTPFKFDSNPERLFAISCESSPEVLQWLRPSYNQFNITYNRGKKYVPDFVVETNDMYYLVEVKASNQMDDPDVKAKKERAIQYCKVASEYNKANGHKTFKYLFIPHDQISTNSSFNVLIFFSLYALLEGCT